MQTYSFYSIRGEVLHSVRPSLLADIFLQHNNVQYCKIETQYECSVTYWTMSKTGELTEQTDCVIDVPWVNLQPIEYTCNHSQSVSLMGNCHVRCPYQVVITLISISCTSNFP